MTVDAVLATALWASGVAVAQPVRPVDLQPLLRLALSSAAPIVLRPASASDDDPLPSSPDHPVPPLESARARVHRRGDRGALLASGAALPVVLQAARMLTGRGVPMGAVELPVLSVEMGLSPKDSDARALLVGPALADAVENGEPGDLALLRDDAIPLAAADARALLDAVLSRVRAT